MCALISERDGESSRDRRRLTLEARQAFVFHGFRFEVLRRQKNRIAALRIMPMEAKGKAKAAS